ncbi:MAG: ComF family protein [Bacteroidia bacterium]|nr:ComF family protein [Bacteroidia bacterium]
MVKNLLNIFFPQVCMGCNTLLSDNEHDLCTSCRHCIPITNFENFENNAVEKIFYGRIRIKQATSLLRFEKKGVVQQMLHNLKYRKQEDVGRFIGSWLGSKLQQHSGFVDVDVVVPVPIHKSKRRQRGYNQVTLFGQEMARHLDAEYVDDVLIKRRSTRTKVFQKRLSRWSDQQESFCLTNAEILSGKHILLVDDIITTGSTIESCVRVLGAIPETEISVASMAITE